jgi:hypothetical protein
MATATQLALPDSKMLRQLVRDHARIKDEPLLLAVHYIPRRDKGDLFLFEIVDGFGGDSVDPERIIFEATYASTPGFEMERGQYLHLLLSNPLEFKTAVRQNWKAIKELRKAISDGHAQVLSKTRKGIGLWRSLHA